MLIQLMLNIFMLTFNFIIFCLDISCIFLKCNKFNFLIWIKLHMGWDAIKLKKISQEFTWIYCSLIYVFKNISILILVFSYLFRWVKLHFILNDTLLFQTLGKHDCMFLFQTLNENDKILQFAFNMPKQSSFTIKMQSDK